MYSATICVILLIVGDACSFALSRSRRDMEQTIFDVYGPPNVPRETNIHSHHMPHLEPGRMMKDMHRHPHHMPPFKPHHDDSKEHAEQPKLYIPQGVLDELFGPPSKRSKPDFESSAPHFYSAINDDVKNTKRKGDKDTPNVNEGDETSLLRKDVISIFGSATSPLETDTSTENSTTSNETATFDTDIRFLSEPLLKTQLLKNIEESNAEEKKVAGKQEARFQHKPELTIREQPDILEHGKARSLLNPGIFENRQEYTSTNLPLESISPDLVILNFNSLESGDSNLTRLPHTTSNSNPSTSNMEHIVHIQITTPSTNASSKLVLSNCLVLVLVYFCCESLHII